MEYGGKLDGDHVRWRGFPKADRPDTLVIDGITLDLVDNGTFREFDGRLHPNHSKQRSSDTVKATLRGRIFARYEGIMGTQQAPAWRGVRPYGLLHAVRRHAGGFA